MNHKDSHGCTPLHLAADYDAVYVAKLLLAHAVDVGARKVGWFTPLHEAAHKDAVDVAKLLLAHAANVGAHDPFGGTQLAVATKAIARWRRSSSNTETSSFVCVYYCSTYYCFASTYKRGGARQMGQRTCHEA